MSSSVFFRFKSQKEPSRVTFDGTGDGTDFELSISSDDTNEVYDDDTSIIPRSTTVIARRLPAAKPGRGGAARYVSGKMPQNAKNIHRSELPTAKSAAQTMSDPGSLSTINVSQTEEQRIEAMFRLGADQWAQQQQHMANATPIHRGGPQKGKALNNPGRDGVPPPGYLCYRCGEKGHWIQSCPTNDDPTFDGKPRVKRTTGIPRSRLQKIEKPTALANDGTLDDTKQPSGRMVDADGDWVVAEPDKASWYQYQAKAKISAAAQEVAARGSKELQDKGLECSIDKRLFVEPTKTPCCQKTYCLECITDALLENDLRCPSCSTDNILIDDLKPDNEKAAEVRKYEEEKSGASQQREGSKSPKTINSQAAPHKTSPSEKIRNPSPVGEDSSKKRPAESELRNERLPPGKSALNTMQSKPNVSNLHLLNQTAEAAPKVSSNSQLPFPSGSFNYPQGRESMPFPIANGLTGIPMAPAMHMGSAMFDPMSSMQNTSMMGGSNVNWNGLWGAGFPQQPLNLPGAVFPNGMMLNGSYGQHNIHVPPDLGFMANGIRPNGHGMGSFANQQRNVFSASAHNEEDSAYFRKPVNPHRHQARRNVNRPTDYHEI